MTQTLGPWTAATNYPREPAWRVCVPAFPGSGILHTLVDVRTEADAHLIAAAPDLLAALQDLQAFVAVMVGRGADCVIPETIETPIGVPVKIGGIMRDAAAAIAKAEGQA